MTVALVLVPSAYGHGGAEPVSVLRDDGETTRFRWRRVEPHVGLSLGPWTPVSGPVIEEIEDLSVTFVRVRRHLG